MQSLEAAWLTTNQIEAARVAMTRHVRRTGQVWIRVFPDKPITKKPAETRMGKGKGEIEYWAAVIKPGTVLFEVAGLAEASAREARYDVRAGTFDFTGNDDRGAAPFVKDQEQATIRANRIVVQPDSRKVSAWGAVQTTIRPGQKRADGTVARTPGLLRQNRPALAASAASRCGGRREAPARRERTHF